MRLGRLTLSKPLMILLLLTAAGTIGETAGPALAQDFDLTDIEIRRVGNDQVHFREFQNRAINDMVARVTEAGVPLDAITSITIDTDASDPSGSFSRGSLSVRYSVWVNIDGCDKSVFGSARATGRLSSFDDRGNCLAQW